MNLSTPDRLIARQPDAARVEGATAMTIIGSTAQNYQQAVVAKDAAARALYRAELAVHDAHQTHVDQWIGAAHERLHLAVTRYLAAESVVAAFDRQSVAA
jgi:hypothetical protein